MEGKGRRATDGVCSDGEIAIEVCETVRNDHVFIVTSTCAPVNVHLMELLLLIRTVVRCSARQITVVIPYMGYSRQDAPSHHNSATVAAADAMFFLATAGATDIISVNLHSEQIEGFVRGPVDNLKPWLVFVGPIRELALGPMSSAPIVLVAPSAKAVTRVQEVRDKLAEFGIDTALAVMVRDMAAKAAPAGAAVEGGLALDVNQIIKGKSEASRTMVGEAMVPGAHCIIVDDIAFTANTLLGSAVDLVERGAASVRAFVTHPVFSQPDIMDRIDAIDGLVSVYVTDTIPLPPDARVSDKVTVISVAEILGEAIVRSYTAEVLPDGAVVSSPPIRGLALPSPRKRRFHINT